MVIWRAFGGRLFDLLTAADVLDRFKGDIRGEILKDSEQGMTQLQHERMSVFKIIAMLRAMATECLLKALWLKHGGKLAKDGKYIIISSRPGEAIQPRT